MDILDERFGIFLELGGFSCTATDELFEMFIAGWDESHSSGYNDGIEDIKDK